MNTYFFKRVALSLCMLFHFPALTHAEQRPPNIILIMADDLGFGELGCYGQTIIKTPRIDQLAKEGMKFSQFYCGNNVCAPSRCCLMTGKHPGHATIRDNANPKDMEQLKQQFAWEFPGQIPIPEDEITLPALLKKSGYATGAMGKWGLGQVGTTGDPSKHGFDLFYGYTAKSMLIVTIQDSFGATTSKNPSKGMMEKQLGKRTLKIDSSKKRPPSLNQTRKARSFSIFRLLFPTSPFKSLMTL